MKKSIVLSLSALMLLHLPEACAQSIGSLKIPVQEKDAYIRLYPAPDKKLAAMVISNKETEVHAMLLDSTLKIVQEKKYKVPFQQKRIHVGVGSEAVVHFQEEGQALALFNLKTWKEELYSLPSMSKDFMPRSLYPTECHVYMYGFLRKAVSQEYQIVVVDRKTGKMETLACPPGNLEFVGYDPQKKTTYATSSGDDIILYSLVGNTCTKEKTVKNKIPNKVLYDAMPLFLPNGSIMVLGHYTSSKYMNNMVSQFEGVFTALFPSKGEPTFNYYPVEQLSNFYCYDKKGRPDKSGLQVEMPLVLKDHVYLPAQTRRVNSNYHPIYSSANIFKFNLSGQFEQVICYPYQDGKSTPWTHNLVPIPQNDGLSLVKTTLGSSMMGFEAGYEYTIHISEKGEVVSNESATYPSELKNLPGNNHWHLIHWYGPYAAYAFKSSKKEFAVSKFMPNGKKW